MTDLLGTCLSWGDGHLVVQPDGDDQSGPVRIPFADIVTGKPVPPRTPPRLRISPRDAQVRALALWPDLWTAPVGTWLLRDSATATARRANSVLAMTASGVQGDYEAVVAHYEGAGKRPIAAVLPDSPEDELFRSHGWVAESTEADTLFEVTGLAQLSRALVDARPPEVTVDLAGDDRLVTAAVSIQGHQVATGVAAYADDWVGFRGIDVDPDHRGRGLALTVMAELVDWGGERGATTAYLQVLADNTRAHALYDGLGFTPHHRYRYLAAPREGLT